MRKRAYRRKNGSPVPKIGLAAITAGAFICLSLFSAKAVLAAIAGLLIVIGAVLLLKG